MKKAPQPQPTPPIFPLPDMLFARILELYMKSARKSANFGACIGGLYGLYTESEFPGAWGIPTICCAVVGYTAGFLWPVSIGCAGYRIAVSDRPRPQ